MTGRRQFLAKAGSFLSLPFLFSDWESLAAEVSRTVEEIMVFEPFSSSCIDLGRYDTKAKQLTVRFVDPKKMSGRFYRYSNVPREIWEKLRQLNEAGGVGGFLNDTIVKDPKRFPFEELRIKEFTMAPQKKKAGSSK
jgi:hypothetical protein